MARFLSHLIISLGLAFTTIHVAASDVPIARDFVRLGETAKSGGQVILLSVSQEHCAFCRKIKDEILRPMLISGSYDDRVLIRELLIDPGEQITDFAGQRRAARDFADQYKVWVTPTLLFLAPDGAELTARMLGIQTVEIYGYYVDESIDRALARLRDADAGPYVPKQEDIGAWPYSWDDLTE